MILPCYQYDKNGLKIYLKVIPNASKNEICGIIYDTNGQQLLKLKITAIADKGKANKAVRKFLSDEWDIPTSDIAIISGETARTKKILITNHTEKCMDYLKTIQLTT